MTTLTMLMVSCGQQDIDGMDAGAGWMWSAVGLHAMQYRSVTFLLSSLVFATTTTINVFASCFGRFTRSDSPPFSVTSLIPPVDFTVDSLICLWSV